LEAQRPLRDADRFSQPNGNGHGEMAMVGCRHGKNTDGDGW